MSRRQHTFIGLAVLLLGIGLGNGLRSVDFYLLATIRSAIGEQDAGRLLLAASEVTALNTARVLPLYIGAFVLMEAWVPMSGSWKKRAVGYLIPAALVLGSYFIIWVAFETPYDFGVPAALSLLGIIAVHALAKVRQGLLLKTTTFATFIFGWQWLGLTPGLAGYGFGNGDLSIEVKTAAEFLGQEQLLSQWSILSCCVFVTIAVIMAKFMVDYSNHVELLKQTQEQELALQQAAMRHLGARTRSEMQALVHDLKTPLTTVQGLVSLIGLTSDDPVAKKHLAQIEQSVDRMNQMISELLHPEVRQVIPASELVRFFKAHMSGGELSDVRCEVGANLPFVQVNVVRLTRAIANIVQNSVEAVAAKVDAGHSSRAGEAVTVWVNGVEDGLRIRIEDQGGGIPPEVMERLFEPGFSTKGSSGLGLSFAREVIVDQHGGCLRVYNSGEDGTCIVVDLPGVKQDD